MIETYGITHLHLVVTDVERSIDFYRNVFGCEPSGVGGIGQTFLQTPKSHDLLALTPADTIGGLSPHSGQDTLPGRNGGIEHFGWILKDQEDVHRACDLVEANGGSVISKIDLFPGYTQAFVTDPDGYVIQL